MTNSADHRTAGRTPRPPARPAAPPGKVLRHPGILRLIHWVHVALIIVYGLTGMYLSRPVLPPHLLRVATVRLIHLTFCPAVIATLVFYLLYVVVSGAWRDLRPVREDWRTAGALLKYEALLSEEAPMRGKYHLLQKLLYLSFGPALLLEAIAGWALLAHQTPSGSLVVRLAYGLQMVRLVHFAGAIYLILTTTLHLYRVLSEPHSLTAMVTGWDRAVPPLNTPEEKAIRPPELR